VAGGIERYKDNRSTKMKIFIVVEEPYFDYCGGIKCIFSSLKEAEQYILENKEEFPNIYLKIEKWNVLEGE
jgi:hypothetical protein